MKVAVIGAGTMGGIAQAFAKRKDTRLSLPILTLSLPKRAAKESLRDFRAE